MKKRETTQKQLNELKADMNKHWNKKKEYLKKINDIKKAVQDVKEKLIKDKVSNKQINKNQMETQEIKNFLKSNKKYS
jgi:septal ring factor EnvC (AmiA/AmiB activator)